ncbi:MAG: amino acid adenylation domain-containing protein, partial [Bacteroidota bacterium]
YQFDPGSLAYNLPRVVRLQGDLNKEKIAEAFVRLIQRHEILRTTFRQTEEGVFQKVNKMIDFEVEQYSCETSEINTVVKSFVRPFDLGDGPLIRAGLVETDSEDYFLMTDLHHIITDGVSQGILVSEFMALYNDEPLAEIHLQYKDYAERQQGAEAKAEIVKQQAYWLSNFAEPAERLELPVDYARPVVSNHRVATSKSSLEYEEVIALRQLANEQGTTMYMVILSIFNILLSKLSNQEDIVVGTPTAGRSHPDIEKMIGMFVNTLPLRNYPKGNCTFKQFLTDVSASTVAGFDNQSYPYEDLVDQLNLSRDTSRNPLFDVMFLWQSLEQSTLKMKMNGLEVTPLDNALEASGFDLTMGVLDVKNKLRLSFQYATDLFKEETIERFIGYFHRIVQAVIANEEVMLSDISVIDKLERRQLLQEFNDTNYHYAQKQSIVDLFEATVTANGDKEAIRCGESLITYSQLNRQVNQLAHYLINHQGIVVGDRVGIYVDRSPLMVTAIMAIVKIGASWVAIDQNFPDERKMSIVQDADLKLIVTDLPNEGIFGSLKVRSFHYHQEYEMIEQMSSTNPDSSITGDLAAYLIYTSGSTGKPKGMTITHHSLLDYTLTFTDHFEVKATDRVVQQAALSFDTSVEEIFPALTSGAALLIMPDAGRDIEYMVEAIEKYQATIMSSTPMVLNEVNRYADQVGSLRIIISGGELLLPDHISNLHGKSSIYNTYGPSESTVCATYHHVDSLDSASLIGKPIRNRKVYITDRYGNLSPMSVAGELCISGAGLTAGYQNNIALNGEKFVVNPFEEGSLMYKSGDLARWLPDGTLEYLGRIDNQVKIRGVRIEPDEIEHQLLTNETVHEVAVVVHEQEREKFLVAYLAASKEVSSTEMRSYLSDKLPEYMIPSYFIQLDSLPLTVNGKLDRRALPAPQLVAKDEYVAPSTELEKELVKIWSEVLRLDVEEISVASSFFEMGGHSLKAAFLANKIRKVLRVEIPLKALFGNQSIAELARYIKTSVSSLFVPIDRAEEKDHYVLSAAQQRLYFLYQFDPESVTYNLPQVVRLEGNPDKEKLVDAFTKLVERHEVLRTVFEQLEEEVVQRIRAEVSFETMQYTCDDNEVNATIKSFVRPFDLSTGPLLRVGLITTTSGAHYLMTDLHHIITDGVSQGILVSDFMALYNGEELPEIRLQYKDYAEWQQD